MQSLRSPGGMRGEASAGGAPAAGAPAGGASAGGAAAGGAAGEARSKVSVWRRREDRVRALREAAARRPAFPDETRAAFQALRLAVNDELAHVARFLRAAPALLAPRGRLAVIAFQPDEDAPVAAACAALAAPGGGFRLVTAAGGAAVRPALEEVRENRRARSAHLRVLERLGGEDGEEEGGGEERERGAEAEAEAARIDEIVGDAVAGLIKRVPPEEPPAHWRAAAPPSEGESEGESDAEVALSPPPPPPRRRGRVRPSRSGGGSGGEGEEEEEGPGEQSFRWTS